jgi:hypothetical protein
VCLCVCCRLQTNILQTNSSAGQCSSAIQGNSKSGGNSFIPVLMFFFLILWFYLTLLPWFLFLLFLQPPPTHPGIVCRATEVGKLLLKLVVYCVVMSDVIWCCVMCHGEQCGALSVVSLMMWYCTVLCCAVLCCAVTAAHFCDVVLLCDIILWCCDVLLAGGSALWYY